MEAIRADGHDVSLIATVAPAASDPDVLALAMAEDRILLTFDKDFGELAWRSGLPARCGVVLFRLPMPPPSLVGVRLAARIAERFDWAGHFSVIEASRIRMRALP